MENCKAKKMGLHEKKRAQAHMVAKARPQQHWVAVLTGVCRLPVL